MTSVSNLHQPSRNSQLAARNSYQSMAGLRRKEALTAYLFIAPTMLGYLAFIARPMVSSLGMSLYVWGIVSSPQFIWLENYAFLIQDPGFRTALRNTMTFAVLVVSLNLVVALALAVALQRTLPTILRYYYRTAFFLPMVTSMASISIVLGFLFHKELGIINYYLGLLGIPPAPWLTSTSWALFTIVLATVWKSFGFDLILFIAGIQNVPRHLYEAAEIDGANGWHQFWRITLPLLSPTIFFAVVVGLISSFQVFDQAFIMTRGGPGDATRTIVMVIYDDAFATLRMGYGSAIATVLFLMILSLTIVQFRVSSKWVHYG